MANPYSGKFLQLSPWGPLGMMERLMNWDPFAELGTSLASGREAMFVPRCEARETRDGYVFHIDVPGVKEEDLTLSVTGTRLTLTGRREAEQREEGDILYQDERSYGAFSRTFTLPEGADLDHAKADLRHGVLTIRVPKRKEVQPRRIPLGGLVDKVKSALKT